MSQINILSKNSHLTLFFATMLALLGIFASVFFISNQQVNAQAATTYTWKDRQLISVTGGNVKAGQSVKVDANDAAPLKGGGRILTSEEVTGRVCGGLFNWFCEDKTVSNDCYVSISLTFNGPSKATLASKKSTIPGAGTPNGPVDCTQVSSYDAYNGKTISIGGTRPGDANTTTETGSQKTVQFTVKTSLTNEKAPATVKLNIRDSQTLTATKNELNGDITYIASTQMSPGNYEVCVEGVEVGCSSFTKVKFQFLTVNIGDSEGAGSREVKVNIKISTVGGMGASSVGPLKIVLYNSAGAEVKSVNTNQVAIENTSQSNSKTYYLAATILDVEAGQYKICIGAGTDTCQDITKEKGSKKNVNFEITGQQALDFVNAGNEIEQLSCTIDGIGWIICPVMNFMGSIIDGAYGVVSAMLSTSPRMFDTSSSEGKATFDAWSIMRNIANVVFVIIFLIIIFSQLTSFGINNYGIKKMLPKLIIAAILVNISFHICALAVDLSNILGNSIKQLIDNITNGLNVSSKDSKWDAAWNGGSVWTYAVGSLIAFAGIAAAVLYAGLSVLLPMLIGAIAAIVTVVIVLTLRQALIVLLIVIAPLAFVALLLPNTEDLFKKWRSLLTTLLLMYPIVALIFGASALAGKIVMGTSTNPLVQIMGAGVTIIPLFITPVIMKTAGGLLNRFGGMVNNPNKGPLDRMRKGAEGVRKDRQNLRNMRALGGEGQFGRGRMVRWNARRKATSSGREAEMNRANTSYIAEQSESNSAFRNAVAGGTNLNPASVSATERAMASSINTQYKLEADEVNASKVVIEHANLSGAERQMLATTGSVEKNGQLYSGATMQKAALQEQLRTGSMSQINEIIANSGGNLSQFSQTISQGVASNNIGAKNPAFGGKTIDDIAQGKITSQADVDATILSAIKEGKFTAETMASMHDLSRTRAMEVAYASDDRSYEQILKKAAQDIKGTPELSAKLSGNESATRQIEELSNLP